MRSLSVLFVACALLVGGVSAQTQSITTPPNFVNNNQGSPGGGVYFDITINPAVLVIESLELNTPAPVGTSVAVDVYTCPATYVGNEANMAAWTLVGSCTGTSAGAGVPTLIDVPNFAMTAGTYGMAIANSGGHAYTNGTGANQTVSTPEITLNLGSATNVAFAGTPFTPRIANLTLNYDVNGTVGGPCIRDRQQNSAEATLTVDGGSSVNLANGASTAVFMDTVNGAVPWDVGLVPLAPSIGALTGAGIVTPGGQSVNVDLANPAFFFLNNNFAGGSFPAGGITFPYAEANFSISGQFVALSPTHPDGVNLSQACDVSWAGCMGADFESGLPAGYATPGQNWGLPTLAWTVDAAGTPSGATGPTSGNGGSANYIYCETSGGAGGGTSEFTLDTCAFDIASLTNLQLDFALSRIGATIGTLNVYMFTDAGGWNPTPVLTYSGPDLTQAQGGTEWSAESYAITALPLGASQVAFSFGYVGGGSFTGDIALDDISVN